ncbi:unnamed protein product, partial [Didymodactylos carnosus]
MQELSASLSSINAIASVDVLCRLCQGGEAVATTNITSLLQDVSAAITVDDTDEFRNVTRLKVLLINNPDNYLQYDTGNSSLVSPIIIVSTNPKVNNTSVQLYFSSIKYGVNPNQTRLLLCSFWDGTAWNSSGCGIPNRISDLVLQQTSIYWCTCSHFTTFALISVLAGKNYSVSILTNISALSTDLVVDAVFDFFGALKNTSVQNAVTVKQVDASILDTVIDKINVSITRSTPEAYLLSTNPQSNNSLLVGASFYASVGGKSITNQDNVIPQITNISAAAVISDELTLENLAFLKILIIDQPDNLRLYDTNE